MKKGVNLILTVVFILVIAAIILSFAADLQFNSAKKLESARLWQEAGEKYRLAIKLNSFNAQYLAGYGDFLRDKSVYQKDRIAWLVMAEKLYARALEQLKAGADALDLNCGPASKDALSDLPWLVETVQEVTDKPISLDSSKPKVIEAGLKVIKNKAIINSTTADPEKLDSLVPLAKKYHAKLIGLTISTKGIPQNKDQRLELAATVVANCADQGFPLEDLYLDPIVLPINVAQAQGKDILESIREFKIISQPPPKTIVGLSNVSQGTCVRNLINRTFLTMAVACGLDAAILDPLDKDLMDALITAELILNKQIYCASFLDAYRKK